LAADLKSADAGNLVGAVHALHKLDHAFSTTWLQAVLERVLDLRSTLTPVQDVEVRRQQQQQQQQQQVIPVHCPQCCQQVNPGMHYIGIHTCAMHPSPRSFCPH
jgi:hypothetical protein